MDEETKLIAKQALEIDKLKETVADYEKRFERIHQIIYCVGGPLNDNLLQYSRKQMGPFAEIAQQADIQREGE